MSPSLVKWIADPLLHFSEAEMIMYNLEYMLVELYYCHFATVSHSVLFVGEEEVLSCNLWCGVRRVVASSYRYVVRYNDKQV